MESTWSKLDFGKYWDEGVGLWTQEGPGHTHSMRNQKKVHPGPAATLRLLVAAQTHSLKNVNVHAVLKALRKTMIQEDSENFGRFMWYAEETTLADDHAVFFNGMVLVSLWSVYGELFDKECKDLLAGILRDMRSYAMIRVSRRGIHYPNEFLGYLLCAWLPGEFFNIQEKRNELIEIMKEAALYWRDNGWGWGEHLSDTYASICVEELSLLLLLSKSLPSDLHTIMKGLLEDLVSLDELFGDGPRVPAIRQYAFLNAPSGLRYREMIKPVPADATLEIDQKIFGKRLAICSAPHRTASGGVWMPFGQTLHELGWHTLLPETQKYRDTKKIPCVNKAFAVAHIEDDVRLGSLSRFPLMPSAEYRNWGLSWQCFPVALWTSNGEWGYLQWETLEQDKYRCHPALEKAQAYLYNALTYTVNPPVFGYTYSLQHGSELLILRVMPMIAATWEALTDRFRLISKKVEVVQKSESGNWNQLVLDFTKREIGIQCVRLSHTPSPEWTESSSGIYDWSVRCSKDHLKNRRAMVTLWGISLTGAIKEQPLIENIPDASSLPRGEDALALRIHWHWPNYCWNVRIDLLDSAPFEEIRNA